MDKTSAKMISFTVVVTGKGEVGSALDPNQGLEKQCHRINDEILNEGASSKRKTWDDKKKGGPPDDQFRNPQQQRQFQNN